MTQRIALINLAMGKKRGGVEIFVIELSNSLHLRGYEVGLYVRDGGRAVLMHVKKLIDKLYVSLCNGGNHSDGDVGQYKKIT